MKICVFSDSHGYLDFMEQAIILEHPDMCLFLGDGEEDIQYLEGKYPQIRFYAVQGNCDIYSSERVTREVNAEGVHILMTHGHKYGYHTHFFERELIDEALCEHCRIALFGHTHQPYRASTLGVEIMNPGSSDRYGKGNYGVIEVLDEFRFWMNLKQVEP